MASRGNGELRITLADGGQLTAGEILFTTGRTLRTADLGLETIGLSPGVWLTVDDTSRVTDLPIAGSTPSATSTSGP